jgi:hypothetical protein
VAKGKYDKGIAKLMLNGLYGKFAQKFDGPRRLYKSPDEYEMVQLEDDGDSFLFPPVASYATAMIRRMMIECAFIVGKDLIYIDTDCLIFKNKIVNNRKLRKAGFIYNGLGGLNEKEGNIKYIKIFGIKKMIFKGENKGKEWVKKVWSGVPTHVIDKLKYNDFSEHKVIESLNNVPAFGGWKKEFKEICI